MRETRHDEGADEGHPSGGIVSRRALLGWAAAGVGSVGVTLASGMPASATTRSLAIPPVETADPAPVAPPFSPGLQPFPQQEDLNFETLFAYGESAYGAA